MQGDTNIIEARASGVVCCSGKNQWTRRKNFICHRRGKCVSRTLDIVNLNREVLCVPSRGVARTVVGADRNKVVACGKSDILAPTSRTYRSGGSCGRDCAASDSAREGVVREVVPFSLRDTCLLYTSPSPRDQRGSRMPSSA